MVGVGLCEQVGDRLFVGLRLRELIPDLVEQRTIFLERLAVMLAQRRDHAVKGGALRAAQVHLMAGALETWDRTHPRVSEFSMENEMPDQAGDEEHVEDE